LLKIFVLLRCLNSGISAEPSCSQRCFPVLKTKVNLNHYQEKTRLNYRLKSEIKMDKRKLIQIIEKELEELKLLSEEVAEDENDTSLIIELALSKARLLCQEIELLRELTAKNIAIATDDLSEENEDELIEEDEVSDVSISDPELEIVNFEESESEEIPEPDEEDEVLPDIDEENEEDDFNEDEIESEEEEPELDEDEATDDDLTEDEDQDESEEEYIEEEIEEELIEFGVTDNYIKEEIEEDEPQLAFEHTELKTDSPQGIREINIDDMDDDDLEPIKISPVSNVTTRPVMREIPKPEELIQEKTVIAEPLTKDRSLNDAIGETKSTEPPLTSGPISSLRAAIGLNDRFLFIREIFANNTDKYNSVIDQLDKLETQQQAVELLKANITLQKNETSMKFVDLLKRRFSK